MTNHQPRVKELSAFMLTPMNESGVDEKAFIRMLQRLVDARVDSIGVLGSTGSYGYLTLQARKRITKLALEHADGIPVMVGVGALRTRDVLELTEDAQKAGASELLLAPVSYQKLTDDEVWHLYDTVNRHLAVPLCVYDNPVTTHFSFSDELHGRLAQLSHIASIKIPGVPDDAAAAAARVARLRALIPPTVSIGVSGDAFALRGLNAGCDLWYSVLAGVFPAVCRRLVSLAAQGESRLTPEMDARLQPVWALFQRYGSLRVVAEMAAQLALTQQDSLPLPLRRIDSEGVAAVKAIVPLLTA
ncbi:dihydrodipicolinate synthase family protein [Affinibrenneria salicis]|uniref:Dihydrodipicolinate synthase family protein n=1 Tax=Affinibrenneria salicis TaxID=2590031 RepID=A0A5J5FTH9_9GAMM|nr:dihydrodipicolinate synthase family protein [Affinibrenneria salicis]KAA8996635.1 dihydrodipicolinate synthase family protein [Affinibrenneria salicis]